MRLQTGVAWIAVLALWGAQPAVGRAGWMTLTSGLGGSARPTDASEFGYGPSAPPLVAIDTVSGAGTVQAVTGGGTVFFTGLGVPVLLNLADGAAYLTGGSPPTGAIDRDSLASAPPQAGAAIADDSVRLGVALSLDDNGAWALTASVFDSRGESLGSGSVVVPEGGWWVLGLGPASRSEPEPELPSDPGSPSSPTSPPGVPEPAAAALVASGVLFVLPRLRRKGRTR